MRSIKAYNPLSKQIFDWVIIFMLFPVLFPTLVLLALLIRLRLGAPILFRQQRPGLHGKPFTLYKFRTMTDACDAERLTAFGRCLRNLDRRRRALPDSHCGVYYGYNWKTILKLEC